MSPAGVTLRYDVRIAWNHREMDWDCFVLVLGTLEKCKVFLIPFLRCWNVRREMRNKISIANQTWLPLSTAMVNRWLLSNKPNSFFLPPKWKFEPHFRTSTGCRITLYHITSEFATSGWYREWNLKQRDSKHRWICRHPPPSSMPMICSPHPPKLLTISKKVPTPFPVVWRIRQKVQPNLRERRWERATTET